MAVAPGPAVVNDAVASRQASGKNFPENILHLIARNQSGRFRFGARNHY